MCVRRQGKGEGEGKGGGPLHKEGQHCTQERHSWKGLCLGVILPTYGLVPQPFALSSRAGHLQHTYVPIADSRPAGM